MRLTIAKALLAAAVGTAATVTAATPAFAIDCPGGVVCLFTKTSQHGTLYTLNPNGYAVDTFYPLTTWYPSHLLLGSVKNHWTARIFISNGEPGPINLCFPPGGGGSPNEDLSTMFFGTATTC
jgi:hypothetical protein